MERREKQTFYISYLNAILSICLAAFKILAGSWSQSHALIADGLHSLSDLAISALIMMASYWSAKRPDSDHPYGHQRIETVASMALGLLLVTVALSLVWGAWKHFSSEQTTNLPYTFLALSMAVVSVLTNEMLYRYTLKFSHQLQSNLLKASALHNRSDVYISLLVVLSILLQYTGWRLADPMVTLVIALFILKTSVQMITHNFQELIDASADSQTVQGITQWVSNTPGVLSIHNLRTRLHAGKIMVDVHILVEPKISVSEGHYISDQVQLSLRQNNPLICDVTVHIDSENDEDYPLPTHLPDRPALLSQLNAHWHHLAGFDQLKGFQIHYLNQKVELDLFFPLSTLPLLTPAVVFQYQAEAQKIPEIHTIQVYFAAESRAS